MVDGESRTTYADGIRFRRKPGTVSAGEMMGVPRKGGAATERVRHRLSFHLRATPDGITGNGIAIQEARAGCGLRRTRGPYQRPVRVVNVMPNRTGGSPLGGFRRHRDRNKGTVRSPFGDTNRDYSLTDFGSKL